MISFNLHQCNIFFDQILRDSSAGVAAYQNYIDNLDTFHLECNFCHCRGECVKNGRYQRGYLLTQDDLNENGTKILIFL